MAAVRDTNSSKPAAKKGLKIGLGWWLIGLAVAIMVLLWMAGDSALIALCYDRQQIREGEYWRLLTGHWVHYGLAHLALNLLGATIITLLFVRTYAIKHWFWVLLMSVLAIDIGFWWYEPQLASYVGSSGVLHGALAAGAVGWWSQDWRKLKLLIISIGQSRFADVARLSVRVLATLALWGILIAKLWSEHVYGASPLAGDMAVIVNSHLYGALGGGATAIAIELHALFSRRKARLAPL